VNIAAALAAPVIEGENRIEEGLAMVQKDLGMVQHDIDFFASIIEPRLA
jgi:hypothetical protein